MSQLDPQLTVRENFLRLNPEPDENSCRAALARFQFRADAALKPVGALSGGQLMRAGLAAVIGGAAPPELLLLDEPTNHLDLESVQALEGGLSGYDGGLIVVSHDLTLLSNLRIDRWLTLAGDGAAGSPGTLIETTAPADAPRCRSRATRPENR
jgi:ATPase subunit of ABC transporter with duplicated ATPase domains